jgi:hypothetical protein
MITKIRNKILHYYSKILQKYFELLLSLKLAPQKRIIILGHMRSGSSLISHILFNHPEILGFGETGNIYGGNNFHYQLISSILLRKNSFFIKKKRRYVMDKILHADYINDTDTLRAIVEDKNTFIIFIMREPSSSIPSILNTFQKARGWNQQDAYDYYLERLEYLKLCAGLKNKKKFFIDYSNFVNNPKCILHNMSIFLNLKTPLQSEYKVSKFTGIWGIGDWSENIFSGKILRDHEKEPSFKEISIDENYIKNASLNYLKIKEELSAICLK